MCPFTLQGERGGGKREVDGLSAFDPSTSARTFRLAVADKYQTTYAAALANIVADTGQSLALRIGRAPVDLGTIEIGVAWHRRDERSTAHRWFRDQLEAMVEDNRPG